jgi:hypothetical protein
MHLDMLRAAMDGKANELCPPSSANSISVLALAETLGVSVFLNVIPPPHPENGRLYGELVMGRAPRILLHRLGKYKVQRPINKQYEDLLTSRERFTVAHELGHWIAYKEYGVAPVLPSGATRGVYWKQEDVMNSFAAKVLLPGWQLSRLLNEVVRRSTLTIFDVNRWSVKTKASRETVAARVCEQYTRIGFLKFLLVKEKPRHLAKVLYSAAGSELRLPKVGARIHNERLLEALTTKDAGTKFSVALA